MSSLRDIKLKASQIAKGTWIPTEGTAVGPYKIGADEINGGIPAWTTNAEQTEAIVINTATGTGVMGGAGGSLVPSASIQGFVWTIDPDNLPEPSAISGIVAAGEVLGVFPPTGGESLFGMSFVKGNTTPGTYDFFANAPTLGDSDMGPGITGVSIGPTDEIIFAYSVNGTNPVVYLYKNGSLLYSYEFTGGAAGLGNNATTFAFANIGGSWTTPTTFKSLNPTTLTYPTGVVATDLEFVTLLSTSGPSGAVDLASYPAIRNNLTYEVASLASPLNTDVGVINNGDFVTFKTSGDIGGITKKHGDVFTDGNNTLTGTNTFTGTVDFTGATVTGAGLPDWAIVTGGEVAEPNDRFLHTSGSNFTVNMPASPAEGDEVYLSCSNGSGTLTIDSNSGGNWFIDGVDQGAATFDLIEDTNAIARYANSTWTIFLVGKTFLDTPHIFTQNMTVNGTFIGSETVNPAGTIKLNDELRANGLPDGYNAISTIETPGGTTTSIFGTVLEDNNVNAPTGVTYQTTFGAAESPNLFGGEQSQPLSAIQHLYNPVDNLRVVYGFMSDGSGGTIATNWLIAETEDITTVPPSVKFAGSDLDASQTTTFGLPKVDAIQDPNNPGALLPGTPDDGDSYIVTDALNLDGSFGTITGLGDNDIITYYNSAFRIAHNVSDSIHTGVLSYDNATDTLNLWNGTVWDEVGAGIAYDTWTPTLTGAFDAAAPLLMTTTKAQPNNPGSSESGTLGFNPGFYYELLTTNIGSNLSGAWSNVIKVENVGAGIDAGIGIYYGAGDWNTGEIVEIRFVDELGNSSDDWSSNTTGLFVSYTIQKLNTTTLRLQIETNSGFSLTKDITTAINGNHYMFFTMDNGSFPTYKIYHGDFFTEESIFDIPVLTYTSASSGDIKESEPEKYIRMRYNVTNQAHQFISDGLRLFVDFGFDLPNIVTFTGGIQTLIDAASYPTDRSNKAYEVAGLGGYEARTLKGSVTDGTLVFFATDESLSGVELDTTLSQQVDKEWTFNDRRVFENVYADWTPLELVVPSQTLILEEDNFNPAKPVKVIDEFTVEPATNLSVFQEAGIFSRPVTTPSGSSSEYGVYFTIPEKGLESFIDCVVRMTSVDGNSYDFQDLNVPYAEASFVTYGGTSFRMKLKIRGESSIETIPTLTDYNASDEFCLTMDDSYNYKVYRNGALLLTDTDPNTDAVTPANIKRVSVFFTGVDTYPNNTMPQIHLVETPASAIVGVEQILATYPKGSIDPTSYPADFEEVAYRITNLDDGLESTGGFVKTGDIVQFNQTDIEGKLINKTYEPVDNVISIQVDASLDPGILPKGGDAYIITNSAALNANFGTITGIADNDIVRYNGTSFDIAMVAADNVGIEVFSKNNNANYTWDGEEWTNTYSIPSDVWTPAELTEEGTSVWRTSESEPGAGETARIVENGVYATQNGSEVEGAWGGQIVDGSSKGLYFRINPADYAVGDAVYVYITNGDGGEAVDWATTANGYILCELTKTSEPDNFNYRLRVNRQSDGNTLSSGTGTTSIPATRDLCIAKDGTTFYLYVTGSAAPNATIAAGSSTYPVFGGAYVKTIFNNVSNYPTNVPSLLTVTPVAEYTNPVTMVNAQTTNGTGKLDTSSYPANRDDLGFSISGLTKPLLTNTGTLDNNDVLVFDSSGSEQTILQSNNKTIRAELSDVIGNGDGRYLIGEQLPDNAIVVSYSVNVIALYNGTTPTMTIGNLLTEDGVAPTTDIDLTATGINFDRTFFDVTTNGKIFATIAGGSSTGSCRIIIEYYI